MLPDLTPRVLNHWHSLFPHLDKPRDLRYTGISGSVEGGTVTFLAFGGKTSKPLFVVKVLRDPLSKERVERERTVLSYLHSLGGPLAASLPKLVMVEQIGHNWVLVQSIVEGQPLQDKGLGDGQADVQIVARNVNVATQWLGELGCATRSHDVVSEAALAHETQTILEQFTNTFYFSDTEAQTLQDIAARLPSLVRGGVCVQHRDFIRENILLREPNKVNVIDWSDSRRSGFVLHDLFFFLTNYFSRMGSGAGIERLQSAFLSTFFHPNRYSALVTQSIQSYLRHTGVPRDHLEIHFGLFLVEHAMFEYKKVLRQTERGSVPKAIIHFAAQRDSSFQEAIKQQIWVHFFRLFVHERHAGHAMLAVDG
ncbi:MAG: aminoglycoside phosphotransferase family protein [Chloroflexota bacterium]|nr:aminoglycoside phosphotransferase family protein [Chloroflexota bacterium]